MQQDPSTNLMKKTMQFSMHYGERLSKQGNLQIIKAGDVWYVYSVVIFRLDNIMFAR
jgi:hypothetical protein